jgi:hypothetical protein
MDASSSRPISPFGRAQKPTRGLALSEALPAACGAPGQGLAPERGAPCQGGPRDGGAHPPSPARRRVLARRAPYGRRHSWRTSQAVLPMDEGVACDDACGLAYRRTHAGRTRRVLLQTDERMPGGQGVRSCLQTNACREDKACGLAYRRTRSWRTRRAVLQRTNAFLEDQACGPPTDERVPGGLGVRSSNGRTHS